TKEIEHAADGLLGLPDQGLVPQVELAVVRKGFAQLLNLLGVPPPDPDAPVQVARGGEFRGAFRLDVEVRVGTLKVAAGFATTASLRFLEVPRFVHQRQRRVAPVAREDDEARVREYRPQRSCNPRV